MLSVYGFDNLIDIMLLGMTHLKEWFNINSNVLVITLLFKWFITNTKCVHDTLINEIIIIITLYCIRIYLFQ